MQNIARQLEQVRQRARMLLIVRRLGQAAAVIIPVLFTLGLIDFGLRLPGWLRGIVAAGLAVAGLVWLGRRLSAAWRFGPSVSALALRVERLYPRLAGLLTSSLEFGLAPEKYAQPATTAALARATVQTAERELAGVRVGRLIDLRPTRKLAMWVVGSVALLTLVVGAMPTHSAIAASRWLMPWADTAWPKRTEVKASRIPGAAAIDSPVEFTATVGRGFKPGMRVWMNARWVGEAEHDFATPIESWLMTEQVGVDSESARATGIEVPEPQGVFKLQWRAPADVARRVSTGELSGATLEVWFEAGDDRTDVQAVTLVARPTLTSALAVIEPPGYAAGLVASQNAALHEQSQRVASVPMLAGSRVQWTLGLNKALPESMLAAEALVPGLAAVADLEVSRPDSRTVVLGFTLDQTIETTVALTDAFGLSNAAERVFRFEASEDRRPSVALLEPSADAAVLRTALVAVAAQANDDVGIRRLTIDAQHPQHVSDRDAEASADPTPQVTLLAEREARSAQLPADAALDLATLDLRVGDVVTLGAQTRDVFDLDGRQHDPVRATPRRLRIIDEATLVSQVRGDLAGVRQQAERLERQQSELQKRLADDDPAALRSEQARLSRAVETQRVQLRRVRERLDMNRLVEPTLDELVRQADTLAERAQQASEAAQSALQEAGQDESAEAASKQQAAAQQAESRENLEALARLLDQGRDVLGLKLELARLRAEQEALAQDTRELLPRTVGRPTEQLPEDLQQALRELSERQEALAEQSEDAVDRLQSSAESLAQQGESDRDRAAAEALAEAAAVAQRQGLSQQMQRSQEGLEENQLSQAGSSQMDSLDTLDQMMEQLGDQDQLRQELLRRRLLALAEKLKRIIEAQTLANAELDALPAALQGDLPGVEGQSKLWVRTIEAQTEAEAEQDTAEVAGILEQAVEAQAAAISALRSAVREEAQAGQRVALERLEEALKKIREQADEASQDQTQQQRAELRKKYLALAARQTALREQTRQLTAEAPLTRKTRAALRGVAQDQTAVRDEAAALGEQVAETVVFQQTHRLIDRAAEAAAASLSRGEDDGRLSSRQRKVATLLESMAAALDESGKPQEFAESGGGGGSGSGSGAGQPSPLVPEAAELKLLRGVQQAVYDETRDLADSGDAHSGVERKARLDDLAAEQRELSAVGKRLIEQMQPGAEQESNRAGEQEQ